MEWGQEVKSMSMRDREVLRELADKLGAINKERGLPTFDEWHKQQEELRKDRERNEKRPSMEGDNKWPNSVAPEGAVAWLVNSHPGSLTVLATEFATDTSTYEEVKQCLYASVEQGDWGAMEYYAALQQARQWLQDTGLWEGIGEQCRDWELSVEKVAEKNRGR